MCASSRCRLLACGGLLLLAACAAPRGAPRAPAPAPAPAPAAVADDAPARDAPSREVAAPQPYDPARAGLVFVTPRGWRTTRRDLALVYEGPMRVPSVAVFEPEADTLEAAVADLARELRAPLGAVRITRAATPTEMAGHAAYVAEGTGRAEGFPMRWRATIVDADRLTIVLGLAPSFLWGPNRGAVLAFERGVRAATPEAASR